MEVNPLVFETSASTDSAIRASFLSNARQRYADFFFTQVAVCFFCSDAGLSAVDGEADAESNVPDVALHIAVSHPADQVYVVSHLRPVAFFLLLAEFVVDNNHTVSGDHDAVRAA